MDDLLHDEALWPSLVDYMDGLTLGPASIRFLGGRRWWRYGSLQRMAEPWGWKDPRNTYTLPLWLALFPEARVLHILRHGVDVAESLRVRRESAMERNTRRYRRLRRLYRNSPWGPKRRGFGPQPRVRALEGGLSLWEAYVERARAHVDALGDRALEVRYESLLASPGVELERALAFCGLRAGRRFVDSAAASMDSDRACAYRHDPALREFAERAADRLARHGYDAAPAAPAGSGRPR